MVLLRSLGGAVAIGFGMIHGTRTQDQQWSEPIQVLVVDQRAGEDSSGLR